jgi:hypothetical protein
MKNNMINQMMSQGSSPEQLCKSSNTVNKFCDIKNEAPKFSPDQRHRSFLISNTGNHFQEDLFIKDVKQLNKNTKNKSNRVQNVENIDSRYKQYEPNNLYLNNMTASVNNHAQNFNNNYQIMLMPSDLNYLNNKNIQGVKNNFQFNCNSAQKTNVGGYGYGANFQQFQQEMEIPKYLSPNLKRNSFVAQQIPLNHRPSFLHVQPNIMSSSNKNSPFDKNQKYLFLIKKLILVGITHQIFQVHLQSRPSPQIQ